MSRGPFYSNEEDQALFALYEDNQKMKKRDLAKKAQRYGICVERNVDALAQHISILVSPPSEDDSSSNDDVDITTFIFEKKYKDLKSKYESLMQTIIDKATLFENGGICFDYKAIWRWIYLNEPERIALRLESLQIESEQGGNK